MPGDGVTHPTEHVSNSKIEIESENKMEKKIKIDVHVPHWQKANQDQFLVVRVEGALSPRVGSYLTEAELLMKCEDSQCQVTQTGVWGSPRRPQ